jgi:hypothetical protein
MFCFFLPAGNPRIFEIGAQPRTFQELLTQKRKHAITRIFVCTSRIMQTKKPKQFPFKQARFHSHPNSSCHQQAGLPCHVCFPEWCCKVLNLGHQEDLGKLASGPSHRTPLATGPQESPQAFWLSRLRC